METRSTTSTKIGRYVLYAPIASGGMATVHFGRLHAEGGFSRTVAIKRLHQQYSGEPEFVARFLDEARIAARIRHPNVVPTLDVVSRGRELFLVMEYAHGESLSRLMGSARDLGQPVPLRIASAIMTAVLQGLHVAHEARSETGTPLKIVHRDVSPQNIVVGSDGVPRILDFGIAKAVDRVQSTKDGAIRGKVAYMAPEQLLDAGVDRLTDVYAASVVFWELLTGERFFGDAELAVIAGRIMKGDAAPLPSTRRADIPLELDALIMKGLSREVGNRPESALAMALEIERIVEPASASRVGEWVQSLAADALRTRAKIVADIESGSVAPEEDFGGGAVESEILSLSDASILESYTAPVPVVTALDRGNAVSTSSGSATAPPAARIARVLGIAAIAIAPVLVLIGWHVTRPSAATPAPAPSAAVEIESNPAGSSSASPPSTPVPVQAATTAPPATASNDPAPPTAAPTRHHHVPATTAATPATAASASAAPQPAASASDNPSTLYKSRR
jgi:serine/threonine-protein kinase